MTNERTLTKQALGYIKRTITAKSPEGVKLNILSTSVADKFGFGDTWAINKIKNREHEYLIDGDKVYYNG
jgi:hypothetical protein